MRSCPSQALRSLAPRFERSSTPSPEAGTEPAAEEAVLMRRIDGEEAKMIAWDSMQKAKAEAAI